MSADAVAAMNDGVRAAAAGASRAPATSKVVQDLLVGMKVGDPAAVEIMQAFVDGYEAFVAAEVARLFPEVKA